MSDSSQLFPQRTRTSLIVFLLLLLLFLGINLLMIGPFLLAVLMGTILATISFPIYARLRKAGIARRTTGLIVTLGVLLLGLAPLGGFGYMSVKQGIAFGQKLSQAQTPDVESVGDWMGSTRLAKTLGASSQQIKKQLHVSLQNTGALGSKMLVGLVSGIPGKLLQLALGILAYFFMLVDGQALLRWISDKLPMDPDIRIRIYKSFQDTALSALLASFAAAAIHSVLMLVAYAVLGVPLAFFAAGATFVLTWIPVVGSTPAWVAASIYLFLQHDTLRGSAMVIFGLIIGISDNVIRPWILKGRNDMHPFIGIISIIGGIEMFGLFGVFYGPVLMGVLLSLLEVWPMIARRFGLVSSRELKTKAVKKAV